MKKRILPLLCLVLLCFGLLRPIEANALTPLDPSAKASLTLHYQKDGKAFSQLQIGIFRVAEAFPDGTFRLIAPFSSYPVNIYDITAQEQWQTVASTLSAYIVANQVSPDYEAQTDTAGAAQFRDVKTGLYLVREVVAENPDGTYLFNTFMVYLPTPQPDGTYNYQVEAKPKCVNFTPKTQYTVTKLWQDSGNQAARPKEVTVDIYQNGVLQQTQVLSAANNWSYTWHVSGEDPGKWTVAERAEKSNYQVTIRQNGSVFTIINTCQSGAHTPPQLGDTFAPLPWMLAMCLSGILLLIMGFSARRRK